MKKEPQRVDFTKSGRFAAILSTPGKHWDKFNPGFGMRVSPKHHSAWIYKGKSSGTGLHYEGTLAYSADGDGVKTFNYQQALDEWAKRKQTLDLSNKEREEQKQIAIREQRKRVTLDQGFSDFIENRLVRGAKTSLQPATTQSYRDRYDRYLRNVTYRGRRIGSYVLADTKARDWKEVIEAIAVSNIQRRNSTDIGKSVVLTPDAKLPAGVPLQDAHAKQVLNLISGIYNYLETLEEVDKNPIRLVRQTTALRSPPTRRTRIKHVDMKAFYTNLKARTKVKQAADAVKVKLFTGMRSSAVQRMRWDRINLDLGVYRVDRGDIGWKGFEGWLPLSDFVLNLLREIQIGAHGYRDSVWVFPSRDRTTHLKSFRGTVEKCGEGLSYRPIPHDLRKTLAGAAQIVLKDVSLVGALLAHRWATDEYGNALPGQAVTMMYITPEIQVLRSAANRVVDVMLQICEERPMTAKTRSLLRENGLSEGHLAAVEIPGDTDEEDE